MQVYSLTCCRLQYPLALADIPRFSWKLRSDKQEDIQTAYQLVITDGAETVYDSGKALSSDTLDVTADFQLLPYHHYDWAVTVWDKDGKASDPASGSFESGPMDLTNVNAQWIANKVIQPVAPGPGGMPPMMMAMGPEAATYFRGSFTADSAPTRARLYLSAEKAVYVTLNGKKADLWLTDPMARTSKKRWLFTSYDLDGLVLPGENVLGVIASGQRIFCQIALTYADGTVKLFGSDDSWSFTSGALSIMPMESGESYDASAELTGWDCPGYDASAWQKAIITPAPAPAMAPKMTPHLCVVSQRHPKSLTKTPQGTWLFDAGEMTVGRITFRGQAPKGTRIKVNLSEKLNDDSSLFIYKTGFGGDGLESMSTSFYTFAGTGDETFAHRIHYTSFQYGEITGYPGDISPEDIVIERIASKVDRISTFDCSEPLFNTLYDNMLRTVENDTHDGLGSTYLDEKGPFQTGDTSFAGEGIMFSEDISAVFMENLRDYHDGQLPDGAFTAADDDDPNGGFLGNGPKKPEWDSSGLYLTKYMDDYAGTRYFTESEYYVNLDYIKSEVAWMQANDYVENSFFGGDWNSPEGEGSPEGGKISGTTCNYKALEYMAEMARDTGHEADLTWCLEEKDKTGDSINRHFLKEDHYETDKKEYFRMWGGPQNWNRDNLLPVGYRQASNIVPLAMGITPEASVDAVLARLVEEIHKDGDHLDCGSSSIKYLLTGLSNLGHADLAYTIAAQRTWPSWGWWVDQGATSMWEHWLPDTRSRDHFFLGAGFLDWVFKSLAGIKDVKEGFKTFTIAPKLPSQLERAEISSDTVRGLVKVAWQRTSTGLALDITVPVGAEAQLVLPISGESQLLKSGNYRFEEKF